MSKRCRGVFLFALLSVLLALGLPPAEAAPAVQKHSSFEYDPQAVVTLSGTVTAIEAASTSTLPEPYFFTLSTPQGKVRVFLGPNWYVAEQGLNISILDRLEVTGAKIIDQGRLVIFAAEVKKGDQTWRIRDEKGRPQWTRQQDRPQ